MDRSERVGSAYFYIEREVLKTTLHVMHSHSSYELYYLVKGEREYFIEDRFFKITAVPEESTPPLIPTNTFSKSSPLFDKIFKKEPMKTSALEIR